jgi:DDE superfamily endonuclease
MLDNVRFYYSERSINILEAARASVGDTPAYPPDFNPVKECVSKIKEALRKARPRTLRKLLNALARAIEKITAV